MGFLKLCAIIIFVFNKILKEIHRFASAFYQKPVTPPKPRQVGGSILHLYFSFTSFWYIFLNFFGFFEVNGDRQMCRSTTINAFFLKKYLISFSRLSLKTCQKHKPCYGSHPSCLLHQQNGPKNFINQQFNFLHLLMWYHDDRDILYLPIWLWSEVKRTLLMIIVPYRHYIGKCLFFP